MLARYRWLSFLVLAVLSQLIIASSAEVQTGAGADHRKKIDQLICAADPAHTALAEVKNTATGKFNSLAKFIGTGNSPVLSGHFTWSPKVAGNVHGLVSGLRLWLLNQALLL